jgi:hypothetical protein
MMYGWNEKPNKLDQAYIVGGETPAQVFELGSYTIIVPYNPDQQATYTHKYRNYKNTDTVFPNMDVSDGCIRIPVEDFVPLILQRLEPSEIAVALWEDSDVRAAFIEAATTRYSQMNIGDDDRRALLAGLKESVHSVALDKLADAMHTQEYAARERAHYYNRAHTFGGFYRSVLETLESHPEAREHVVRCHGEKPFSHTNEDAREWDIGGKHWNESRHYWRKEVLRQFPAPVEAQEVEDTAA